MPAQPVPIDSLCIQCDPNQFRFTSTEELQELEETIGQRRATEALKFGTEISNAGYNIYALGPHTVGMHQIIEQFLRGIASKTEAPADWVYVNNFSESEKPISISFPPGMARKFQADVRQMVEDLRTTIPSIFESDSYRERRDSLLKMFKEKQDKSLDDLQDRAKKENMQLLTIGGGLVFAQADKRGKLLDGSEIDKLPEEEKKRILERLNKFNEELISIIGQIPIMERQLRTSIKHLNREMISSAVETLIKELKTKYGEVKNVNEYLEDMFQDIIDNAHNFRRPHEERSELEEQIFLPLRRYDVNVVVDHSDNHGAPVVYEDNPTFMNLVGQIEHLARMGTLVTDFTLIKAGALHRANGGYLILDINKLLTSPYAWEGLKRALKSESIRIESLGQVYSLISTVSLEPEPIPLRCKIILIGDREIYHLLMRLDPEFSELFRVSADFEDEIPRSAESEALFARLLGSLIRRGKLQHLDPTGAAKVIDFSSRLAADSERISVSLEPISNLLKEASFFAREAGRNIVTGAEVKMAIDAQIRRTSRFYEKIIEETLRGNLLIDLDGERVGQINGLSVFEFGDHIFGHPARITASVRMGDGQVIDIERETKMGGAIHSKGVLILSGFLKSRFATDVPFSISASLVFEQTYGPVEGDSASLAELIALLSALSEVPVKQSIAVTGSVNQRGEVQPVGGINEKVEGFFDLCKGRGFSGRQGVVIPKSNIKNLSLRDDVIEVISGKQNFTLYSVENVEDCMTLLTDVPFDEIAGKIESKLRAFAEKLSMMKKPEGPMKTPEPLKRVA